MRGILEEIRSGAFAKELFADDEAGRPRFNELREQGEQRAAEIERVGKELRELAGVEGCSAGGTWRQLTSASHSSATARSAPRSTACSPRAPTRSSARPATGCASCARSCATRRRSARSPPTDGVLTTDFAAIRDDPSIDVVAEVMGGLEPAGGYVRELLARRQAGRVREQAARRARGRRAVRHRVGRRRAAAVRGVRLRGDPGRQGAPRVARRRRTSIACSGSSTGRRTSSSRAWSGAARTPRRSRRRRRSATQRPIRPTT